VPGLPVEPLGDAVVTLISVLVAGIAVEDGLSAQ